MYRVDRFNECLVCYVLCHLSGSCSIFLSFFLDVCVCVGVLAFQFISVSVVQVLLLLWNEVEKSPRARAYFITEMLSLSFIIRDNTVWYFLSCSIRQNVTLHCYYNVWMLLRVAVTHPHHSILYTYIYIQLKRRNCTGRMDRIEQHRMPLTFFHHRTWIHLMLPKLPY